MAKSGFHSKQFTLRITANQVQFYHNRDTIIADGLNEALSALKMFAHIIEHLVYETIDFGSIYGREFYEYGKKYCPQATKEIIIHTVDEKALANWTYSFDETATKVTIRSLQYDLLPLNQLFPFLADLSVRQVRQPIVQHFPHLTTYTSLSFHKDHTNQNLFELIRLNPQLRYFYTSARNNLQYLRYLSRMLPNVKTIDMDIDFSGQCIGPHAIHFRNITEWSLRIINLAWDSYIFAIGDITFDQLETLKVEAADNFASEIIRLMLQYQHLKKLEIHMGLTINEMQSLVRATPSLKEFTFNLDRYEMFNIVGPLLLENHGLEKITVHSPSNKVRAETLAEVTPAAWKLVENETPKNSYSFIRNEL